MEVRDYNIEEIVYEYPDKYRDLIRNELNITEDELEIFLFGLIM